MFSMLFAVLAVFVKMNFFWRIEFIAHGHVIGRFTNRTNHTD